MAILCSIFSLSAAAQFLQRGRGQARKLNIRALRLACEVTGGRCHSIAALFPHPTNGYRYLGHRHYRRLRTRGINQIFPPGSFSSLSECRPGMAERPGSVSKLQVRLSLFSAFRRRHGTYGEVAPEIGEHFLATAKHFLFSCCPKLDLPCRGSGQVRVRTKPTDFSPDSAALARQLKQRPGESARSGGVAGCGSGSDAWLVDGGRDRFD